MKNFIEFSEQIFKNAPLGIARVSKEGRFLDVNPKLCEMLKYSREELLELTVFDITADQDLPVSYDRLDKITSRIIDGFDLEKRYIKKDGQSCWVRIVVRTHFDEKGQIDYFISTFEDISEKILFQEKLVASEKKYRSIIDTTPQGFWIVDFNLNILEVNQAYCDMIGYTRDELLTMKITDLEVDEDADDIAYRQKMILEQGKVNFNTHHKRKDQSIVSLGVAASIFKDDPNYIFAFFYDRTELESTIDALNFSKQVILDTRSEIATVSEETLRQIGRDLHDDLGQTLTGASMIVDSLNIDIKGNEKLQQLANLLSEAVSKTRSLSHGLYPVELDSHGLIPMLSSLISTIQKTSTIKLELITNRNIDHLSPEQSLNIFRIAQEALNNVLRHSQAKKASVKIESLNYLFKLEVVDDGVGVSDMTLAMQKGLGFKTMQYRAEKIGAQVIFRNRAPKGFLMQIYLHFLN